MKKIKKQKNQEQQEQEYNRKTGFYYSFLTIVLIFCLIQIGYGAILNISKIISYQNKTRILENVLKHAKMQNQDLKSERKMVTSDNSLEGIARNNLKMAKDDEVLIIINKKVEKPKKKKKFIDLKNFNFLKKDKTQENLPIPAPIIPEEIMDE